VEGNLNINKLKYKQTMTTAILILLLSATWFLLGYKFATIHPPKKKLPTKL